MDEAKKPDESPDESLASVPPKPYVAPEVPLVPLAKKAGVELALFSAAGAGALFLLSGMMLPCVGATRSVKLKWDERREEIEQAICDTESNDREISE